MFEVTYSCEAADAEVSDEEEESLDKIKSQFVVRDLSNEGSPELEPPVTVVAPPRKTLPPFCHLGTFEDEDEGCKCLVSSLAEATHVQVWNLVGRIFSICTSDDSCIEVHFNDSSLHEDFVVDNTTAAYDLGDLNSKAVALASSLPPER